MTCFWDSILTCLNDDDYRFANIGKGNHKHFITQLKLRNRPMESIQWQREKLREQEIKEHMEAIKDYNINGIHSGHLTSICDSFLLLICELFHINIIHRYLNINISYSHPNPRKTFKFNSNKGHFQVG